MFCGHSNIKMYQMRFNLSFPLYKTWSNSHIITLITGRSDTLGNIQQRLFYKFVKFHSNTLYFIILIYIRC